MFCEIVLDEKTEALAAKIVGAMESIAQSDEEISSLEFNLDFTGEELVLLNQLIKACLEDKEIKFIAILESIYKKLTKA